MSSHPTLPRNTSPWMLLGVGVGASVLGAAAAAATVLYLQPRIGAPAPSVAQAPAAEVAPVRVLVGLRHIHSNRVSMVLFAPSAVPAQAHQPLPCAGERAGGCQNELRVPARH